MNELQSDHSNKITFIVGKNETEIDINRYIIASSSPVLIRMMESPMQESTQKCVILPNIDPNAFKIFINLIKLKIDFTDIAKDDILKVATIADQYI